MKVLPANSSLILKVSPSKTQSLKAESKPASPSSLALVSAPPNHFISDNVYSSVASKRTSAAVREKGFLDKIQNFAIGVSTIGALGTGIHATLVGNTQLAIGVGVGVGVGAIPGSLIARKGVKANEEKIREAGIQVGETEVEDLRKNASYGLINFDMKGDKRGFLIAIEQLKDIPFEIKRVYYIGGAGKEFIRGQHAHTKLQQVLICTSGSCKIEVDNGEKKEIIELNKKSQGLFLGGTIWRTMFDFSSEDCVLLVLASEPYDEEEYIRDYDKFLEESKKIRDLKPFSQPKDKA